MLLSGLPAPKALEGYFLKEWIVNTGRM